MAQPVQSFKMALLQLLKVKDKEQNVKYALEKIRQVVKECQVKVVVLPECFAGPYETTKFAEYSEAVPNGPTCQQLAKIAKELNIYVVGGTLMEKDAGKIYNTCAVWGPQGNLLGKHRKVHLFDVTMDTTKYRESDSLTPGSDYTMVNIEGHKVAITVCYDLRFDEFARAYKNEGAEMIINPAAFDIYMGPIHWDIILRGRANDLECYVAGVSSARDENDPFVLYGHTMFVDPWGTVLREASEKEEVIIADVDFKRLEKLRQQIPLQQQRRLDLYETIKKK